MRMSFVKSLWILVYNYAAAAKVVSSFLVVNNNNNNNNKHLTPSLPSHHHHHHQRAIHRTPLTKSCCPSPSARISHHQTKGKMDANDQNKNAAAAKHRAFNDDDNVFPSSYTKLDTQDENEDNDDDDVYFEVVDGMGCTALVDRVKNDENRDTRWVRVEKGFSAAMQQQFQTIPNVLAEIHRVRQIQSHYGPSDLYERQWEAATTATTTAVPTTTTRPVTNGDGKLRNSISVMQFNTLAEGLSSSGSVPTPFHPTTTTRESSSSSRTKRNNKDMGNEFGGFTNIKSPQVCLDFSLRKWRLIEVMIQQFLKHGGTNDADDLFDLMGMQEVDRFHGFFAPVLKLFGYQGIFAPKPIAPGIRYGWYSDGCALFWKSSVFHLITKRCHEYHVGNQVLLLATLEHRPTKRLFVVAVTHLKAQKNPNNEVIRCAQVEELLQCVTEAVHQAAEYQQQRQQQQMETAIIPEEIPILILGDFNADPPCRIKSGDSSVGILLNHHHHRTSKFKNNGKQQRLVRSAYPLDPPKPGFYTTWKTRGNDTAKRIIDYIMYGGRGLSCTHLLRVPDGRELEEGRLPGLRYPSDHMMMAAKFEF